MIRQMWRTVFLVCLLSTGGAWAVTMSIPPSKLSEGSEGNGEPEVHDTVGAEDEGISLQLEEARMLHKMFDSDGDGKASKEELLRYGAKVRRHMNYKATQKQGLPKVDFNNDGKVSLDELDKLLESEQKEIVAMSNDYERNLFKHSDLNGDGELDAKELPAMFFPDHHDDALTFHIKHTLAARDANADGKLSLEEFYELTDKKWGPTRRQKDDFESLDQDKNELLDLEELRKWESKQYHEEANMANLLEALDANQDGFISEEELDMKVLEVHSQSQHAGVYWMMQGWFEHHSEHKDFHDEF